jgi:hypothetical protein
MKKYKYEVECKNCNKTKIVERFGACEKRFLTSVSWKFQDDYLGGYHICPECSNN